MALHIKIRHILLIALFIGGLVACSKNKSHPVPNIPFDVTIDLSLPSYSDLIGVGGYAYVNGGSKGIVVYRRGVSDFVAFDRHSPEDVDGDCPTPLVNDSSNYLMLNDNCNSAQFSMYDGSPVSSTSEFGLRQYQTVWDGNQSLRVYN